MTDRDDELKEYFSSRPSQEEFRFDQTNWEKMHASLKAARQNKRRRFFIYLSLLFVIAGLTGAYILLENETSPDKLVTKSVQKTNSEKSASPATAEEPKEENKHSHKTNSPVDPSTMNPSEKLQTKPLEQNTTETKNPTIIANIPYANELTAGKVEITLKRILPSPQIASVDEDKSASPKVTADKKQPEVKNTPDKTPETFAVKEPEKHEDLNPVTLSNTAQIDESQIQKENPAPSVINNTTTASSDTTQEKTRNETGEGPKPLVPKQDSVVPKLTLGKDSLPKIIPKVDPKKILSVEIGSNYLLGWKNAGKTEANGFNPIIGLNYYNGITEKVGFSIGMQYTSINNLKNTSHTSTTTRLRFGEEVDVTTISARKMHYLVAPLKLSYSLNDKNIFCLGYNIAYLLDVKSNVETYSESLNSRTNYEVSSAMGYRTGFGKFDGQLSFCYRRKIYKELFINSEFFYGIIDIKNNSIYNSDLFERSRGFKLSLSYNLFKK